MSAGMSVMALEESDVTKFLCARTHMGTRNVNYQMEQYIFKRRPDGINIINLRKTYEKLLLAARAIAAIENPADVYVISSRKQGQRAVLKFAHYTGATSIAGRFTPGAFTNQIQAAFREPRLLVVNDPWTDRQPITEASYVSIPVIAFCNIHSPLRLVDVAIPCNNRGSRSSGLMWWMLAREVLRLRGTISRTLPWETDVMPDLFFHRSPRSLRRAARLEALKAKQAAEAAKVTAEAPAENWPAGEAADPEAIAAAAAAATAAPEAAVAAAAPAAAAAAPAAAAAAPAPVDDWGQAGDDWASPAPGTGDDWGGAADGANW